MSFSLFWFPFNAWAEAGAAVQPAVCRAALVEAPPAAFPQAAAEQMPAEADWAARQLAAVERVPAVAGGKAGGGTQLLLRLPRPHCWWVWTDRCSCPLLLPPRWRRRRRSPGVPLVEEEEEGVRGSGWARWQVTGPV